VDLWRLQVFCGVVEQSSFSKAAAVIRLSQPTVSSHVKDLEDHFSCKLVDRLGRTAAPTKAGQLLYDYAKQLLQLKEDTEKALAEFQGKMIGHLTIGGSTIPGGYILPALIGHFKRTYPDIFITLIQGDSADIVSDVSGGKVELGVVGTPARQPRLAEQRFMEDQMYLFVSAEHKWANEDSVSLEMLATEPFILREVGSGTRTSIEVALQNAGHWLTDLNVVAEMGSTEAVRESIKSGVGISILSACAFEEDTRKGIVRGIPIEGISLLRSFYLITDKQRTQSPLCQAFIEFLKSQKDKDATTI
jgi:DNA-binding transcriptional LysR family regulator